MNIGLDDAEGPGVQQVRERVRADFDDIQLPWLRDLIEIPSHTHAPADVEVAFGPLDRLAGELGMSIRRFPDGEKRFADHRVYMAPGVTLDQANLALVGHVDTVFPREMGFLSFRRGSGRAEGREPEYSPDGPEMFGPGVLDMKSGLSAMMFGCRAVARVHPELWAQLPLVVICVSDEEVGSPHSRQLFAELAPNLAAGLVFEGGREHDRIITSRKGGGSFTITARGRAAHAGNDHARGINAIAALATLIPRVEALTRYDAGVTVNTGLIEGGTAKNTVPDTASCVIDARFETRADAQALTAELEKVVTAGIPEQFADCGYSEATFELSGGVSRYPMEATDASRTLAQLYGRFAAQTGLGQGEAPRQGGGSDANLLADAGVPCIDGLGPMGKYFHKVEEWSDIASLRRRTEALAAFLVAREGLGAALTLRHPVQPESK